MRTGHLLALRHGSERSELLVAPEAGIVAVTEKFRELLLCIGVHPEYQRVELYTNEGLQRRLIFKAPAASAEPAAGSGRGRRR